MRSGGRSSGDAAQARTAALQCLAQTGNLQELIARTEEQLRKTPTSLRLVERLSELYEAGGQADKSLELQARLVELRPSDGQLRFGYAQRLQRGGKFDDACRQYALAIKAEPRILQRDSSEVLQAFRRANKTADLVQVLNEIDLRALGQYWTIGDLIGEMVRNKEQIPIAVKLLQRAWQAFPDQRSYLSSVFSTPEIWQQPGVYEMVRQTLVPSAAASQRDPWLGLHANSYSQDGEIIGLLTYLLRAAGGAKNLEQLRGEVAAALPQRPSWQGGRALLAILDLRQGRVAQAQAALASLLTEEVTKAMPADVLRVIAQELEKHPSLREVAVRLYEVALTNSDRGPDEFEYTAGPRLVRMYQESGRREPARKLLLEAATRPSSRGYDADYAAYQRVRSLSQVAQQLATLDFPADALRLYHEILLVAESPEARNSQYYSSLQDGLTRARQELQRFVDGIDSRQLAETADLLLAPPLGRDSQSFLDLMVVVTEEANSPPRIESLLFKVFQASALNEQVAAAVRRRLAELTEKHPQDLTVQVAASVFALRTESGEPVRTALQRLTAAMEAAPLEKLPPGQRANARQRKDAAAQIPLWLAARECLAREDCRDAGQALAERAVAAARRQLDARHVQAMWQEWAQSALAAGDLPRAAGIYREMLAQTLGRTAVKPPPSSAAEARTPPVTLSQFRAAMQVARATAERLPDVSLQAVAAALEGGPPVPDPAPAGPRSRAVALPSPTSDAAAEPGIVAAALPPVIAAWQRHGVPPERIYETLASVVFTRSRPDEILLYPRTLSASLARAVNGSTDGLAQTLAEVAVRSNRLEDLQQRIAARSSQPAAEIAGRVLRLQLALARQDPGTVKQQLAALTDLLKARPVSHHLDLACPAALAVMSRHAELMSAAMPLLEFAATSPAVRQSGGDGSLHMLVARTYLDAGQAEAAKPSLDRYTEARLQTYSRYGGDYGPYMHHRDLAELAGLAARCGHVLLGLDYLGQFADIPTTSRGEPEITPALWHLARHVAALPAPAAYELLRDWTLPTETRRSVRLVAAFNPGRTLPDEFVADRLRRLGQKEDLSVPARLQQDFGAISNIGLLVEVASAAGRLDELTQRAAQAAADKVLRAETLYALCCIAAGDRTRGEPLVRAALEDTRRRHRGDATSEAEKRPQWRDYVVMQGCLRSPEFVDLGRTFAAELLQFSRERYHSPFMLHLGYESALAGLRQAPPDQREAARQTGLALWIPGAPPLATRYDSPPAWWSAQEGQVVHLTGLENDRLYFRWPLTGEFEFSVDVTSEHFGTGELGYAGLACEPMPWANNVTMWPTSWHESLTLPRAVEAFPGFHRRMSVEVRLDSVRFLVNDHLVYAERAPSPTSPWLHIICLNSRQTAFRNPRLTGKPSIPREVPLSHADRLDGWTASLLGHRLPLRLTAPRTTRGGPNAANVPPSRDDSRPIQWWSADGVIHGRFQAGDDGGASQSLLVYDRPLQSGDSVQYEFRYEPGKTQVHPSLGGLAFLLAEDGVRLHWTAPNGDSHVPYDVPPGNALAVPQDPSAAGKLPLQAGQWNRVQVSLEGRTVRIQLNGQFVVQRLLEPTNDGKFGLFHFADKTAAQTRNIVLRGNWPEQLTADQLQELFATDAEQLSPEGLRARHAIIGEAFLTRNPEDVWSAARSMPAEPAYELLRQWVLPGRLHPTFRLQGAFTPLDPAPPVAEKVVAPGLTAPVAAEPRLGGQYIAPAIELVRLARELGRLDVLAAQVDRARRGAPSDRANVAPPLRDGNSASLRGGEDVVGWAVPTTAACAWWAQPTLHLVQASLVDLIFSQPRSDATTLVTPQDLRSITALRVLLSIAAEDDAAAQQALVELFTLSRQLPPDTPHHERYPEATAVAAALERPQLIGTALGLADWLVEFQQDNYVSSPWERTVRYLRGIARWRLDAATAALPRTAPPAMQQWSVVNHIVAKERGLGFPAGPWWFERGEVQRHPGNSIDGLYFDTPLRGNFEIEYEMSTYGWREIYLGYAVIGLLIRYDGQAVSRNTLGREWHSIDLDHKLDGWGPWVQCRIAVRDGTLFWFANGRQVHQEPLAEHADPWVFIRTLHAQFDGRVRNVRITGAPQIPEQIELSAGDGLLGWRSDYYEESLSGENSDWRKDRDEIVGRRTDGADGSFRESILYYHRPLLENGQLSYEFFYEAGKQEVHPTLDRLVFLLRPEGVAGHWLTDGGYERLGLSPDNRFAFPAAEVLTQGGPLPLQPKAWNQLRLTLAGDILTISLNGKAVVRHQLEPDNQRHFGLFHYSDATQVRVRNVVHRGDWPKQLPPVDQQELALPALPAPAFDSQQKPQTISAELHLPAADLEKLGVFVWGVPPTRQATADGVRLSLPPGIKKGQVVGYELKTPVPGDFEITATVDGFRLDKSSLAVAAFLKDPGGHNSPALEWVLLRDGTSRLSPTRHSHWPDSSPRYIQQPQDAPPQVTAMRLVRRGGRIYYLYQTEERGEFRVLDSFDVGAHQVASFALYLVALDDNAQAEATFRQLSLRAAPAASN